MYSTLAMPSLKPQGVNFTSFPSCHILSVKRTCWGAQEHQSTRVCTQRRRSLAAVPPNSGTDESCELYERRNTVRLPKTRLRRP